MHPADRWGNRRTAPGMCPLQKNQGKKIRMLPRRSPGCTALRILRSGQAGALRPGLLLDRHDILRYCVLPRGQRALYPLGEMTGAEPDPWVIRGVSTRDRVLHFEQLASRDSL